MLQIIQKKRQIFAPFFTILKMRNKNRRLQTFTVCNIVYLLTCSFFLFISCQKEEIPEQITTVSVKAGKFNFSLSFAPFGEDNSIRSLKPENENSHIISTQDPKSESIVIPIGDDSFIYATLSTDVAEEKHSVSIRDFEPNSKIRIVAYKSSVVATEAIFIVNGNTLIREGGDDARFDLPPDDYTFVAYSYNNSSEPLAIAPLLENISPSNDLIWGVSAPVHLEGPAVDVLIRMYHKMSQIKAVFTTGTGGDPITTISGVTIPGFLVNMTTETGVLSNAGAIDQVIAIAASPNSSTVESVPRTVFTGNPSANPTIIYIDTIIAGSNTIANVYATFAKSLQSGFSYKLTMNIGESPDIKDDKPPTGFIPYIGAFWKTHQTGERLIRIPRAPLGGADGSWTAQVIVGKDWIRLDTQMSSDNNIGWRGTGNEANVDNGNNSGFDTNHAVSSISTFVYGHLREIGSEGYQSGDENIYFRIGLTDSNPDPMPRYGMVLLTYADNELRQRIWIRQGEDADYLMRPDDVFSSSTRPDAQKFSPYNLTDPYGNSQTDYNSMAYGTGLLGANGGTFVDYPTQAGYFFQWNNSTRAFNPYLPTFSNWNTAFGIEYWNGFIDEVCPLNYRRPNDGNNTVHNTTGDIANSEIRQSLWLTPKVSSIPSTDNSVWGYYADGFFDRRTITDGPGAYSETNSSVSVGDNQIAHIGRLFFNPDNYASLFFPTAGYRSYTGNLQDVGHIGYYWTTTSYNASEAWYYAHNHDVLAAMLYGYRNCSNSVRCVYEPLPATSIWPHVISLTGSAYTPTLLPEETVTVVSGTSWTLTSSDPSWLLLSLNYDGTGASTSVSTSGNATVYLVVTGNPSTTAPRVANIIMDGIIQTVVTQDPYVDGGFSERITWDPETSTYILTSNFHDAGLYFKFGSVVGIFSGTGNFNQFLPGSNTSTFNASTQVAWSPVSTITNAWSTVPTAHSLWNATTNPTVTVDGSFHTLSHVRAGMGDPCRLVGLDLSAIADPNNPNPVIDNGIWMLPTPIENGQFTAGGTPSTPNKHWWGDGYTTNITPPIVAPLSVFGGVIGAEFPQRNSLPGQHPDPAKFLPANGWRTNSGQVTSQGGYGFTGPQQPQGRYWANHLQTNTNNQAQAQSLGFNEGSASTSAQLYDPLLGFGIRCVRQK